MTKRLGDICEFVGGGTPSKKNPEFYGGSIPWATVRDMNVRVIESTEHSITPDAVQQSATNIIPKGEVVISTHVGLGKVCFLGQDTAINQDLKAVIPRKGLSRRYLYYWFVSKADELIANYNINRYIYIGLFTFPDLFYECLLFQYRWRISSHQKQGKNRNSCNACKD